MSSPLEKIPVSAERRRNNSSAAQVESATPIQEDVQASSNDLRLENPNANASPSSSGSEPGSGLSSSSSSNRLYLRPMALSPPPPASKLASTEGLYYFIAASIGVCAFLFSYFLYGANWMHLEALYAPMASAKATILSSLASGLSFTLSIFGVSSLFLQSLSQNANSISLNSTKTSTMLNSSAIHNTIWGTPRSDIFFSASSVDAEPIEVNFSWFSLMDEAGIKLDSSYHTRQGHEDLSSTFLKPSRFYHKGTQKEYDMVEYTETGTSSVDSSRSHISSQSTRTVIDREIGLELEMKFNTQQYAQEDSASQEFQGFSLHFTAEAIPRDDTLSKKNMPSTPSFISWHLISSHKTDNMTLNFRPQEPIQVVHFFHNKQVRRPLFNENNDQLYKPFWMILRISPETAVTSFVSAYHNELIDSWNKNPENTDPLNLAGPAHESARISRTILTENLISTHAPSGIPALVMDLVNKMTPEAKKAYLAEKNIPVSLTSALNPVLPRRRGQILFLRDATKEKFMTLLFPLSSKGKMGKNGKRRVLSLKIDVVPDLDSQASVESFLRTLPAQEAKEVRSAIEGYRERMKPIWEHFGLPSR